jgi:hypothetical protein
MDHFYQNIQGWFSFDRIYKSVVNELNEGLIVEVGSWLGKSSAFMAVEIYNSKKPIAFHCVDHWNGSEEHQNRDIVKDNQLYETFLKNMKPVKDIVIPIRKTSLEASKDYNDASINFVFIDASHDYENVKSDLDAWYPKIKPGCLFGGHDYGPTHHEVRKAVDEFCLKNSYQVTSKDDCWIIRKRK